MSTLMVMMRFCLGLKNLVTPLFPFALLDCGRSYKILVWNYGREPPS